MFRAPGLVLYALAAGIGFHVFVTLYEEPHLRRRFGAEYEQYCASVGRWLPRRAST
jgi:protein-S-isoprenylcysteine O-methyltransferase Ste14